VFGVSVGQPTSGSVLTLFGRAGVTADEHSGRRFGSGALS
jgi:hypothetical protein